MHYISDGSFHMSAMSAECLLISALLNTSTFGSESQYGISAADFLGYSDEYGWCVNYVETYACQPTKDVFAIKFPGFVFSEHTDVRSACEMVHIGSNRRRLTTAITEASDLMHLGELGAAHQVLVAAEPRHAVVPPHPLLVDTHHLDEWHNRPYHVELPYPTLQRHTGGIRAGNLWYLAARPGQGKSAHLSSISKAAVLAGNRVLFYSLEMSEEEVRARFHAALASEMGYPTITLTNLRSRAVDLTVYRKFVGELNERLEACGGSLDVHTPADGPVSPSVIAARCSEYHLTVVDYITLMRADSGTPGIADWRVIAEISNAIKTIALANKVGILCAAQINREGDTGNAPPKVKNLSQSDALGQDGDVVLTMRSTKDVATHFSIEKNRHGPSGIHFFTTFSPNTGAYSEISADQAEDLVINAEALADAPVPPQLRVIKSKDQL
jgi:replicative DNA helicase